MRPLQLALIAKGVDLGSSAAALMQAALNSGDDEMLGALVLRAREPIIEALGIDYRHMTEAGLPHTACMWLKRFEADPGEVKSWGQGLGVDGQGVEASAGEGAAASVRCANARVYSARRVT